MVPGGGWKLFSSFAKGEWCPNPPPDPPFKRQKPPPHPREPRKGAWLHLEEENARHTEWERPLVVSTYTLEVVTGMTTRTFGRVAANLGWDKVTLPHPVFHGDTLYAASTILSKRDSKSRPAQGILQIATEGANQDGRVVIRFERTILMYKRGHGPYEAAGY